MSELSILQKELEGGGSGSGWSSPPNCLPRCAVSQPLQTPLLQNVLWPGLAGLPSGLSGPHRHHQTQHRQPTCNATLGTPVPATPPTACSVARSPGRADWPPRFVSQFGARQGEVLITVVQCRVTLAAPRQSNSRSLHLCCCGWPIKHAYEKTEQERVCNSSSVRRQVVCVESGVSASFSLGRRSLQHNQDVVVISGKKVQYKSKLANNKKYC